MLTNLIKMLFLKYEKKKINTKIYSRYVSKDLKIGCNCIIGKCAYIYENVKIGNFSYLNSSNLKTIIESNVEIGDFCSIGPGVIIGMGNHYVNTVTTHPILFDKYYSKVFKEQILEQQLEGLIDKDKKTLIGSDVWIGARANIKRGVHIGNGAIVAAESVVTKDVPDYAIVAGVPAKVIKYRFSESKINFLVKYESSCFWNWNKEFLVNNFHTLYDIEDYIKVVERIVKSTNLS